MSDTYRRPGHISLTSISVGIHQHRLDHISHVVERNTALCVYCQCDTNSSSTDDVCPGSACHIARPLDRETRMGGLPQLVKEVHLLLIHPADGLLRCTTTFPYRLPLGKPISVLVICISRSVHSPNYAGFVIGWPCNMESALVSDMGTYFMAHAHGRTPIRVSRSRGLAIWKTL